MAFIRDPRPVRQQILSGLKISAVLIAVGATVLLLGPYIPVRRIEAYIWHLRHGNSIGIGQYRVPVPKYWYVWPMEGNPPTNGVLMTDLNTGDGISAQQSDLLKGRTLSEWSEWVSRAFATSQTTKKTGQRDYRINGETFRCLEEDFDNGPKLGHLYSIECLSEGGLEVQFMTGLGVGRGHDAAFYSLLQRIQKL